MKSLIGLVAGVFSVCWPTLVQAQPSQISTLAGTGTYGYSGDNGPATAAQMDMAYAIAVDPGGNVIYFADSWNHRIRMIYRHNGVISTAAGTGEAGYSGDGGDARAAKLFCPRGIAVDAAGNLFISDTGNSRIRMVTPNGTITTVAGTGTPGYSGDGGEAVSAGVFCPRGLTIDQSGNLYIADTWNFRIRKVTPNGTISTFAGNGAYGSSGDGGQASAAALGVIQSLAVDGQGSLYLTDVYGHRVRKVAANGVISTVIGGGFGSGGDGGPAQSAQLRFPRGVAADTQGNLYVADSGNHCVRMIATDGVVRTLAGTRSPGYSGDNGPASAAQLNNPYDAIVDLSGNLLVTDSRNYRLRAIELQSGGPGRPLLSAAAGVQNSASFQQMASPGMLATIWGEKLSEGTASATSTPLPTTLAGTIVYVDTTPIPLLYVSPTQINCQLPTDLSQGTHSLKVAVAGMESESLSFEVRASAPGLFALQDQHGAVLNQDYSINSPSNPASRGSFVTIYATGQGEVSPPLATGVAAPWSGDLHWTVDQPTVIIGGKTAEIQFSGLAPGLVGAWQINAIVAIDASTGDAVPVIASMDGTASNSVMISVR